MKRFKNILVAIDTRQKSHPIVDEAVDIAKANDAKLTIVDVIPDFSWLVRLTMKDHEHVHDLIDQEKQVELDQLVLLIKEQGVDVSSKVLSGKTSVELLKQVKSGDHDLIMRVAKGQDSRRKGFFGNTGLQLLRHCPCAVWLVSPMSSPEFNHVLGCVDTLSENEADMQLNDEVYELSQSISESHDGKFSILHAWSIWNEQMLKGRMTSDDYLELEERNRQQAKAMVSRFLEKHGTDLENERVHLIQGDPATTISSFVNDNEVDLLVMGTVGRTGVSGFLMGNTAEQILHHVHCSVLALKPSDFRSAAS